MESFENKNGETTGDKLLKASNINPSGIIEPKNVKNDCDQNVLNIMHFFESIRLEYSGEPEVYEKFIKLMQSYGKNRLHSDGFKISNEIVEQVKDIFNDNQKFYYGFLAFLPGNSSNNTDLINLLEFAENIDKNTQDSTTKVVSNSNPTPPVSFISRNALNEPSNFKLQNNKNDYINGAFDTVGIESQGSAKVSNTISEFDKFKLNDPVVNSVFTPINISSRTSEHFENVNKSIMAVSDVLCETDLTQHKIDPSNVSTVETQITIANNDETEAIEAKALPISKNDVNHAQPVLPETNSLKINSKDMNQISHSLVNPVHLNEVELTLTKANRKNSKRRIERIAYTALDDSITIQDDEADEYRPYNHNKLTEKMKKRGSKNDLRREKYKQSPRFRRTKNENNNYILEENYSNSQSDFNDDKYNFSHVGLPTYNSEEDLSYVQNMTSLIPQHDQPPKMVRTKGMPVESMKSYPVGNYKEFTPDVRQRENEIRTNYPVNHTPSNTVEIPSHGNSTAINKKTSERNSRDKTSSIADQNLPKFDKTPEGSKTNTGRVTNGAAESVGYDYYKPSDGTASANVSSKISQHDKNSTPNNERSTNVQNNLPPMYSFPYRPPPMMYAPYGTIPPFAVARNVNDNVAYDERAFYGHSLPPHYFFPNPNGNEPPNMIPYQMPTPFSPQFLPIGSLPPIEDGPNGVLPVPYPLPAYALPLYRRPEVPVKMHSRRESGVSSVSVADKMNEGKSNVDRKPKNNFHKDETLDKHHLNGLYGNPELQIGARIDQYKSSGVTNSTLSHGKVDVESKKTSSVMKFDPAKKINSKHVPVDYQVGKVSVSANNKIPDPLDNLAVKPLTSEESKNLPESKMDNVSTQFSDLKLDLDKFAINNLEKLSKNEKKIAAIGFISTVKLYLSNIEGSSGSYEEFVSLLFTYQENFYQLRQSKGLPEDIENGCQLLLRTLIENVEKLFQHNDELVNAFFQFLPTFNFLKFESNMDLPYVDQHVESTNSNDSPMPILPHLDQFFCTELKNSLPSAHYDRCIKAFYLFNKCIINEPELFSMLQQILESEPELYTKFCLFFRNNSRFGSNFSETTTNVQNIVPPTSTAVPAAFPSSENCVLSKKSAVHQNDKFYPSTIITEPQTAFQVNSGDLRIATGVGNINKFPNLEENLNFRARDYIDRGKPIGKNYFNFTDDKPTWKCSGETYSHKKVTNCLYISEATVLKPEDAETFLNIEGFSVKNPYVNELDKVEEERYEIDMVIDLNKKAIEHLETISLIRDNDTKMKRLFEDNMKFVLSSALFNLYGEDHGRFLTGLVTNTYDTLDILITRMIQKQEEWESVRLKCEQKWANVVAHNYFRSLDHMAPIFKMKDMKKLKLKPLIKELEHCEDSGLSLVLPYTSLEAVECVSNIVMYYAKRQAILDSEQKSILEKLVKRDFLAKFFDKATLSKGSLIIYCNDELYTFFRLHQILCERFGDMLTLCRKASTGFKEIKELNVKQNQDRNYEISSKQTTDNFQDVKLSQNNSQRKTSETAPLRKNESNSNIHNFKSRYNEFPFLKNRRIYPAYSSFRGSTAYIDFKNHFIKLLQDLLDKNMNHDQFEDDCRYLYGLNSYCCFTFEKLIVAIVKQLNSVLLNSKCQYVLTKFLEHTSIDMFNEKRYFDELHSHVKASRYFKMCFNYRVGEVKQERFYQVLSSNVEKSCNVVITNEITSVNKDTELAEKHKLTNRVGPRTRMTKFLMANAIANALNTSNNHMLPNYLNCPELTLYYEYISKSGEQSIMNNTTVAQNLNMACQSNLFLVKNLKNNIAHLITPTNINNNNNNNDSNSVDPTNPLTTFLNKIEISDNGSHEIVKSKFVYNLNNDHQYLMFNAENKIRSKLHFNNRPKNTGFLDSLCK